MNSLFPGILTNCILEPERREQKIENVSLFLKVAREVGVTDPQLFECEALVDGTDLHSVYDTLHALASVAWELGAAPFHIVDRNSCRDVLSVFEMWLSQFWNDFMDATGPAVSEMIAAFVRNQLKALNDNKPDNLLAQPLTLVLKAHATMKARLAQVCREDASRLVASLCV
ncbi:hypothetical protein SARC_13921 [Sphaeroforma arctica JP610]|uniref:Calponin-homology (CH) domain-containing protein n=1 Tax=Sphaeroforma arctica JP610 TaxID=667725 RepID=A0A0L0F9X2_9EUKA|nr:hypothetical protein SARC_13921 [Sphaeroforma arctica JP610]KNC73519.1 hypothetical protein SARC_13921 [Sphaeroforma arctica JP610]|eukprot:XP_014147421.1 hypothetical protein SARC_13921 [Sphaeroforma arctica JP610]